MPGCLQSPWSLQQEYSSQNQRCGYWKQAFPPTARRKGRPRDPSSRTWVWTRLNYNRSHTYFSHLIKNWKVALQTLTWNPRSIKTRENTATEKRKPQVTKMNPLQVWFLCLRRILPNSSALKTEASTWTPSTAWSTTRSCTCTSLSRTTCPSPARAPKGQWARPLAQNPVSRARHERGPRGASLSVPLRSLTVRPPPCALICPVMRLLPQSVGRTQGLTLQESSGLHLLGTGTTLECRSGCCQLESDLKKKINNKNYSGKIGLETY